MDSDWRYSDSDSHLLFMTEDENEEKCNDKLLGKAHYVNEMKDTLFDLSWNVSAVAKHNHIFTKIN